MAKAYLQNNKMRIANIHDMSNYSIVGDIYTGLPALTKAIKEKVG